MEVIMNTSEKETHLKPQVIKDILLREVSLFLRNSAYKKSVWKL